MRRVRAIEPDGTVQRVRDARDRTIELRRQLGQIARRLSAAYEEAARQNELLATNRRPPVRFDHQVAAKRWRLLAETAAVTGEVPDEPVPNCRGSARCPRCSEPISSEVMLELAAGVATTARCPRCGGDACLGLLPASAAGQMSIADLVAGAVADEDLRIATDLGNGVVQKLFAVGLRLGSVVDGTTGVARQRLEEAIREVDASIALVRAAAFGLDASGERRP